MTRMYQHAIALSLGKKLLTYKIENQNKCFFPASAVEYCTGEKFNVNCGPNQVIKTKKAYYGRMSITSRCVNSNIMGNIGCRTDVLPFVDWLCAGKRTCSSHVPHAKMKLMNTMSGACNEDLQSYLEVEYDCLEGNALLFESNGTRQWRLPYID